MKKKTGYGIVYKDVMKLDISIMAKGLYAYLASFTGSDKEYCYPSYKTIMKDLSIAKATVSKLLKELEQAGIIEKKKVFSGTNKYYITDQKDFTKVHEMNTESSRDEPAKVHEMNSNINSNNINSNNIYSAFEIFWNKYDKKIDKKTCIRRFKNLSKTRQIKCIAAIDSYFAYLDDQKKNGFNQQKMNPSTWLNGRFEDEYTIKPKQQQTKQTLKIKEVQKPSWLNI